MLSLVLIAALAALYGANVDTDTYFLALIVPTAIGGVLMEGLYTVLLRMFERDVRPSLAAALRVTVPVSLLTAILYVAGLLVLSPTRLHVWLAFAPILFTTSVGGVYAARLLVQRRYNLSILRVPLATALAVVAVSAIMPFWRSVTAFALAIACGHLTALAFLAVRARRGGPAPAAEEPRLAMMQLLAAAAPIFLATLVGGQVVILVERFFASGIGPGAVTLIAYARGIAVIPVQIAQALGNAILPAAAERERSFGREALARLNVLVLRFGLVAASVSTAYIVICRREIVRTVLQRGDFDAGKAHATATLAALLALSLVGLSTATIAGKALYGVGRQRVVAATTTAGVAVYVALAFPARTLWQTNGLALAYSASSLVAGSILAFALGAGSGVRPATALKEWLLVPGLLAGAFALGAYGGWALVAGGSGTGRAVATLAVSLVAGLTALAGLAAALRGPEYEFLRLALRKTRLGGLRARVAGRAT